MVDYNGLLCGIIQHNDVATLGNTPPHEATMGHLGASVVIEKGEGPEHMYPSIEDRIKAQDEMVMVLQAAGCSMEQPNGEGKTPRQLLEETRPGANWHRIEESKGKPRIKGRGRG